MLFGGPQWFALFAALASLYACATRSVPWMPIKAPLGPGKLVIESLGSSAVEYVRASHGSRSVPTMATIVDLPRAPVGKAPQWDKFSVEERRALSAERAAEELRAQGLPLIASPEQHRTIARILADAEKARTRSGATGS